MLWSVFSAWGTQFSQLRNWNGWGCGVKKLLPKPESKSATSPWGVGVGGGGAWGEKAAAQTRIQIGNLSIILSPAFSPLGHAI